METVVFNLYQKLGDYFTGSHRRRSLYIGVILLFIVLNSLSYSFKIVTDTETLYWVFSSLVQALLALVALVGVVSIFKLQNLHEYKNRLIKESQEIRYSGRLNGNYSTIEALLNAVNGYLSVPRQGVGENHYMSVMKRDIDDFFLSKKLVVDYSRKYTIYTFSVALVALLFLMLVPQISNLYLGINSLYLMFVLTSYSLFLAAKGFAYSIDG